MLWLVATAAALVEPESFLRGVKALDQIAHFNADHPLSDGLEVPGGAAALNALEESAGAASAPEPTVWPEPKPLHFAAKPAPVLATAEPAGGATVAALRSQLAAAQEQRSAMAATLASQKAQAEHFDAQLAAERTQQGGLGAQLASEKAQVASLETKLHRVGGFVDKMKAAEASKMSKTQAIARAEAKKVQELAQKDAKDAAGLQVAQSKVAELTAQLASVAAERDAAVAELPQLKALQAATDHSAVQHLDALKAEQANSQTLRDELARTTAEARAAQQKLQTAQAEAAEAKRGDKAEKQTMQAKWLNFTASVQGVLHHEDEQLAAAQAESASVSAALVEAKQEKAALSTRLSDVSNEAQRMGAALKAQGDHRDGLEGQVAALAKQQRAAEAAAERNAARAEALASKLKAAEKAAAHAATTAKTTQAGEQQRAAAEAVGVEGRVAKAEAEAKHADGIAAAAEQRVRQLQNVTAQDATLLRAAASRLRTVAKPAPDKELLGQLSRSEKRLRKALVAWKGEKEEVHKLKLAAQRDDTEKAQLRTRIAQQRQELAHAKEDELDLAS